MAILHLSRRSHDLEKYRVCVHIYIALFLFYLFNVYTSLYERFVQALVSRPYVTRARFQHRCIIYDIPTFTARSVLKFRQL